MTILGYCRQRPSRSCVNIACDCAGGDMEIEKEAATALSYLSEILDL